MQKRRRITNVTTDTKGEIRISDLKPGSYTVTEVVADQYEPQEVRTVTVVSGQTATVTFNNVLKRGSLQVGGTKELRLNITYNYASIFYRPEVFGEGGVRSIYGMTGAESIPILKKAIEVLADDVDPDYRKATEGIFANYCRWHNCDRMESGMGISDMLILLNQIFTLNSWIKNTKRI